MHESPEEQILPELGKGEQLLWAGRPRQGLVLRASDGLLIPFSLMWGGFAIFWEAMAINQGAPIFFCLFGIPFVVVGMYLMIGRFWVDAYQRSRTVYGVTSERIVIISSPCGRRMRSLNIETVPDVTLTERSNGGGTITFAALPPFFGQYARSWPGHAGSIIPTFELPDQAREVCEIIREVQRQARQRVTPDKP
jgi:hypothetical protein